MSSFQPPTRELPSFKFFKNDPANKLLLKWRIQKFLLLIYLLSKKLTLKFFCSKLKVHVYLLLPLQRYSKKTLVGLICITPCIYYPVRTFLPCPQGEDSRLSKYYHGDALSIINFQYITIFTSNTLCICLAFISTQGWVVLNMINVTQDQCKFFIYFFSFAMGFFFYIFPHQFQVILRQNPTKPQPISQVFGLL